MNKNKLNPSYSPKGSFRNCKTRAKEELRNLSNESLCVLGAIVFKNMLGNGGVADDNEIAGAGGEAVDGAVLLHPFEEWEEEGAAKEVGDVVELGIGDGDAGVVAGEGPGDGGEPVRAHPRAIGGYAAGFLLLGGRRRRRRRVCF